MKIKFITILSLALLLSGCLEPDSENIWSLDPVASVNTFGYCRGIFVHDDLAFVAAGQGGVQVWDMDPLFTSESDPLLKTHVKLTDIGFSKDISQVYYSAVNQQILGLETNERPFQLDYSNPANPAFIGSYMSEYTKEFVVVDDSLEIVLITADADDGIGIAQYSGMTVNDTLVLYFPGISFEIGVNGRPSGVTLHDSLLAVTREQLGVSLYRYNGLSSAPTLLGEADTQGDPLSVTFLDDKGMFVSANEGGCYYFDLNSGSDLSAEPVQFAADLRVYQVAISNDIAVLALGGSGLALYDISDPANPESRGVYDIGHVYKTYFANGYLLAATREGLQVFSVGL